MRRGTNFLLFFLFYGTHLSCNTFGMNEQVKRLLSVETEEMYKTRLMEEAKRKAVRPPRIIQHAPPSK